MPYIPVSDRLTFDSALLTAVRKIRNPGQLNYFITSILLEYLKQEQPSYSTYNEIIGALECAKQEFYRRAIVPYEEKKRKENGDVF